ncbi:hypothetical protein HK101_003922 [Irineochytrium annulatum]|nr:hypothetical protein HK101_003922 [Irineochytrium annulatum]
MQPAHPAARPPPSEMRNREKWEEAHFGRKLSSGTLVMPSIGDGASEPVPGSQGRTVAAGVADWGVGEVAGWLRGVGVGEEWVEVVKGNNIDGHALLRLTPDDLLGRFGFQEENGRNRLWFAVSRLQSQAAATGGLSPTDSGVLPPYPQEPSL